MMKEEDKVFRIWKEEQKAHVADLEEDVDLRGGLRDIFIDRAVEPFGTWKGALSRSGKLQQLTEAPKQQPPENNGSQSRQETSAPKTKQELEEEKKAAETRAAVKKVFADLNSETKKKAWGLRPDRPTLEWVSENEIAVGQHLNNHFSEAASLLGRAGARWNQEKGAFVVVA